MNLKTSLLAIVAIQLSTHVFATDVTGAGSTFAYPIYAKWADTYKTKSGIGLNYQAIGSGGGIKQIEAQTVDFGATDMPLKQESLTQKGLVQFPTIMGGVVPVVNITGVTPGQLKLSGEALADIYLGKIKKWNDPAIVALNPTLKSVDENIAVVRRADGSGTTFIFTNYLSKVSDEWKNKVGSDTAVAWPEGLGGKGNEGVATYVQRIKGAIGYVEYAYAKNNKMVYTQMKNHDGVFVEPDAASFQAAATYADWAHAPAFYEILTNEPGKTSWPITGATFALMQKSEANADNAKTVLSFFDWSFHNGQKAAADLDYVPMPDNVVQLIKAAWHDQIKDKSGKVIWN